MFNDGKTKGNLDEVKLICKRSGKITLEFTRISDKELIYNMMISPDIVNYMFDDQHPAPTLEEFSQEADFLYCGESNKEGNYLIIKYEDVVIGSISYSLSEGIIKSYEIDIWIAKKAYLGKGIGSNSINMLIDYIGETYGVNSFIIRPWHKNTNAIKAYKKCGFIEINKFELKRYYSEDDYIEYGDGDYGEDTVNLVLNR